MKRLLFLRFCSVLSGLILAAILAGCAHESQPQQSGAQVQQNEVRGSVAPAPAQEQKDLSTADEAVSAKSRSSSRLGTQWGEGIDDHVNSVALDRVSDTPLAVMRISYSSRSGRGHSINEAMLAHGRIGLSILNDHDGKWPLTQNGQQIHLRGRDGERYQLFYRNYSGRTYEIVATIDGLDVISGEAGSINNRGYVLHPHDTLQIEGFRKNDDEVAAFRFSAVADSYAANTPAGSAKNAGVIGTAVFALKAPRGRAHRRSTRPDSPQAFPGDDHRNGSDDGDHNYAPPPSYRE